MAADLGSLSAAVQEPDGDLETLLRAFAGHLRLTIGSYLGLMLTIALDGHEISVSVREQAGTAATSLRVPLSAIALSEAASALVLYAGTSGAFVDLAADLSWALQLDPSALSLDEHLPAAVAAESVVGLREHAAINRAIGVLIEQGHTPESARTELRRVAGLDSGDVPGAAQRILDGVRRPPLSNDR
jgi:hypothetical protein